ncbi:MAG TPA: hypothetical protein VFX66_03710 [Sulfuricurvum sp.]|nr:hypothetical protein [Sulfuricurvum sp.]
MQHVVSQLIEKRRELSGELKHHQSVINKLTTELNAIDISISVFDPNIKPKELKPIRFSTKNRYFKHSEAITLVLDVLREAERPIITSDLVKQVMIKKEYDLTDKELYNGIFPTVRATLYAQEKKGILVIDSAGPGKDAYWSINPN